MSKIQFQKLSDQAIKPHQALASAGFDLFSAMAVTIAPGTVGRVKTNIALEMNPGTFGLIRDRSSVGSKGIIVTGGVIDADYRGDIMVCLLNLSQSFHVIHPGDKIAQLLILKYESPELVQTDELTTTERGSNGFGSTDASTK